MSQKKTITRKLQLWEIEYEGAESLRNKPTLKEIFESIRNLPFRMEVPQSTDPTDVRELQVDNSILVVDVLDFKSGAIEGAFGRGRDFDVPKFRRGREQRDLELKPGEYIEDPSHFVVFDDGFIVFERNPNGPNLSAFGIYLKRKCPHLLSDADVKRVPRGDFLDRIQKANVIRKFILKMGIRGIKRFATDDDDDPFSALEKLQKLTHFETITIELSTRHKSAGLVWPKKKRMIDIIKESKSESDILKLELRAKMIDSGEIEVIKLFKNPCLERPIRFKGRGNQKTLDRDEIFRAIYTAHNIFKRIIEGGGDESDLSIEVVQEALDTL